MAGINDIKPTGFVWPSSATQPTSAVKKHQQAPKRQPQQQNEDDKDKDKDDDEPNHIDEYA